MLYSLTSEVPDLETGATQIAARNETGQIGVLENQAPKIKQKTFRNDEWLSGEV